MLIDQGCDSEADWFTLVTQMIDPVSNSLLLLYNDAQSIYGKHRRANFRDWSFRWSPLSGWVTCPIASKFGRHFDRVA